QELRLQIYRHCTALSLLQLAHSCSSLYNEVNAHPSIVRGSYGFYQGYSIDSTVHGWRRYRHRPIPGQLQDLPYRHHYAKQQKEFEQCGPREYLPLSILDIERIHPAELHLITELYGVGTSKGSWDASSNSFIAVLSWFRLSIGFGGARRYGAR
ncbi:hypothetical protein BJ508DRAFT_346051, partial [Ascobolus immersus RN42]